MEGQKSISFICVNVKAIAPFGCTLEDVSFANKVCNLMYCFPTLPVIVLN